MTQRHIEVATETLRQLGRGRVNALAVMTGAKHIMAEDKGIGALRFRLPNNAKDGINFVRITLTPSDTYHVEYGRVWGSKYTPIYSDDGIYCDTLADSFEARTGLYLSF